MRLRSKVEKKRKENKPELMNLRSHTLYLMAKKRDLPCRRESR